MWTYVLALLVVACTTYGILLSKRLDQSRFNRSQSGVPFPSDEELLQESSTWSHIDVLDGTNAAQPTNKRYLVTGASGQFGVYTVSLLHRRGERQIYCLDIAPLPPSLQSLEGVHFIKCNVTDAQAVRAAFEQAKPDVVLHFCASIRFWERASFTYRHSAIVNIDGTKNIIDALKAAPSTSEKILIYCSSAAICLPEPLFMRLGWNWRKGYSASYTISDDREIPDKDAARHSYPRTKAVADRLVREAHGRGGLRAGVLRPGMSVCSPNDLFAGMIMRQPYNPTFVGSYAQHFVNSQDLAACFLQYETALRERPEEVGGDAFLVTGDRNILTWDEMRHVVQLFAHRNLRYMPLHALPLYILAHFLEAYCIARYYALLPFHRISGDTMPSPHPRWMEKMKLHQLQPAMWNTAGSDVSIDDSRCRKVLGYRNRFTNAQTLRWIVETHEASQNEKVAERKEAETTTFRDSGVALARMDGLASAMRRVGEK